MSDQVIRTEILTKYSEGRFGIGSFSKQFLETSGTPVTSNWTSRPDLNPENWQIREDLIPESWSNQ